MGQPHQLFLVARVRPAPGEPKEYRCVAAFCHNWCYAKLPLYCANRFKRLARTKANAALIQRDLDLYHEGVQHSPETPCPYISFLASAAFTTDLDHVGDRPRAYFSRIHYLSADRLPMPGAFTWVTR